MSFNEIEEDDGNGDDGENINTIDKELVDSIINEPIEYENLDLEEDVNEFDDIIKIMCEHHYATKHGIRMTVLEWF